ncbi:MAG TPA: alpha/beta hydrolase [Burkholderiales bacterium]
MPRLQIGDWQIEYRERGRGVPVVLTPGGRWAGYVMDTLAEALAREFRVVTWDRSNTDGASSVVLSGEASEADIWADQLAGLIRALGLAPCYVGEYAGCRTTPLLCVKHPELVKGLMLAWPSGGEVPAERLPRNMHRPYIRAALRSGMAEVARTRVFAASVEKNPANRERLLARPALEFVRQMAYWEAYFTTSADLPTAGCRLSEEEWRSIRVPASVTGGVDPVHPTIAAQRIHALLPNSSYHDPVVTLEEWDAVFNVKPYPETSRLQGSRIAPVWRDFIHATEGRPS